MEELIAQIVIWAQPFLRGWVSVDTIRIWAIPAFAVASTSTFLILVVGAMYILRKFRMVENPFRGGDWDDDNW